MDFDVLNDYVLQLNVDIGAAAYWNEMTNNTTLSNLYQAQLIDGETYLDCIPTSLLPQKTRIIEELKKRREQQAQMPTDPNMMGGM